jgi:hypothetical protein
MPGGLVMAHAAGRCREVGLLLMTGGRMTGLQLADPATQALHSAVLRYPAENIRVDWRDRGEHPLPNYGVRNPAFAKPAAYAYSAQAFSSSVFDPK